MIPCARRCPVLCAPRVTRTKSREGYRGAPPITCGPLVCCPQRFFDRKHGRLNWALSEATGRHTCPLSSLGSLNGKRAEPRDGDDQKAGEEHGRTEPDRTGGEERTGEQHDRSAE